MSASSVRCRLKVKSMSRISACFFKSSVKSTYPWVRRDRSDKNEGYFLFGPLHSMSVLQQLTTNCSQLWWPSYAAFPRARYGTARHGICVFPLARSTWYQVLFWYLPGPGSKRAEAILKRDVSRLPSTDWPTSVVTGSVISAISAISDDRPDCK